MKVPLLVASDLDGPLLDPHNRVTARTRAAVLGVRSAGTTFVAVTGRGHRWLRPLLAGSGISGIAICANGAVTYDLDSDSVLASATMDPAVLAEVLHVVRERFPACRVAAERAVVGTVVSNENSGVHDVATAAFVAEPGFTVPWPDADFVEFADGEFSTDGCVKLLVRDPSSSSVDMARLARDVVGDRAEVTVSSEGGLIDLSAPSTTKATALAAFVAERGIGTDAVMSFGDMPNDIDMLSWSGYSVAMGHAPPEVKKVADEVTTSNDEDGVALVLERFFA